MPNQIVDHYRNENPSSQLTDEQITLHYAEQYSDELPNLLQTYPDFAADYSAIYDRAFPLTAGDKAAQAGKSLIGGIAGTIGSIPESLGILQSETLGRLGIGERDFRETYMGQIAGGIRDAGDYVSPEVPVGKAERMADSFWLTKAPGALGSGVGFIGMGGPTGKLVQSFLRGGVEKKARDIAESTAKSTLAKSPIWTQAGVHHIAREKGVEAAQKYAKEAAQRANTGTIAGLGAAANAAGGYRDALANGATPDQAVASYILNGIVGTSEAIPLARMLNRLDTASGGTLMYFLSNAAVETFEEAVQEAAQGAAGDIIAANIVQYDPDRELFKDLAEDAAAGGVSGAILSLFASAINRKVSRLDSSEKPMGTTGADVDDEGNIDPRVEELFTTTADVAREAYKDDPKTLEAIENLVRRTVDNLSATPRNADELSLRAKEGDEIRSEYDKLVAGNPNADVIYRVALFKAMHRQSAERGSVTIKANLADPFAPVAIEEKTIDQTVPGLAVEKPEKIVGRQGGGAALSKLADTLGVPLIQGEGTVAPTAEEVVEEVPQEIEKTPDPSLDFRARARETAVGTNVSPIPLRFAALQQREAEEQPAKERERPSAILPTAGGLKKKRAGKQLVLSNLTKKAVAAEEKGEPTDELLGKMVEVETEIEVLNKKIDEIEESKKSTLSTAENNDANARNSIRLGGQQVIENADNNLKLSREKIDSIEKEVEGSSPEDSNLILNVKSNVNVINRLQTQKVNLETKKQKRTKQLLREKKGKNNPNIILGHEKALRDINSQIEKIDETITEIQGKIDGFTKEEIDSGEATVKAPRGAATDKVLRNYTSAAQQKADAQIEVKNADENNPLSIANVDVDVSNKDNVVKAGPAYYEFGELGQGETTTTEFSNQATFILEQYNEAEQAGLEAEQDRIANELAIVLARGSFDKLTSSGTRRQIVFKAPDGKVWVLGLHRGGKKAAKWMVTPPLTDSNDPSYQGLEFSEILKSGFVPFAAIRFKLAAQKFNYQVGSVSEFKDLVNETKLQVVNTPAYLKQAGSLKAASKISIENLIDTLEVTRGAGGDVVDSAEDPEIGKTISQELIDNAPAEEVIDLSGAAYFTEESAGFIYDLIDIGMQEDSELTAEVAIAEAIDNIQEANEALYNQLIGLGVTSNELIAFSDLIEKRIKNGFKEYGQTRETFIEGVINDADIQEIAERLQKQTIKNSQQEQRETDELVEGDQQSTNKNAPDRPANAYPRVPQAKLNRIFTFLIERMKSLGVQVEITEKEFANAESKSRAMFGVANGKPFIVLAMNAMESPTVENLYDLLHEIGHAATNDLLEGDRARVLKAISQLKDVTLRIPGRKYKYETDAEVAEETVQEERLVEALAEALINNEFDPTTANNIATKIVKFFKDLFLAVKQAYHRMIGNEGQVAMDYFRIQVEAMLTGNHAPKYISWISGYKYSVSERMSSMEMVDSDSLIDSVHSLNNKTVQYKEVVGDSPEAVEHNLLFTKVMFAPDRDMYDQVDLAVVRMEAQRIIATNNALKDILSNLHDSFRRTSGVYGKMSKENFIKEITNNKLPDERIKKALEISGDPSLADTQLQDLEVEEARPRAAEALDKLLRQVETNISSLRIEADTQLSFDVKSSAVSRHKELQIKLNLLASNYESLREVQNRIVETVDEVVKGKAEKTDNMISKALSEMGETATDEEIQKARDAIVGRGKSTDRALNIARAERITDAFERLATLVSNEASLGAIPWKNAKKIKEFIESLGDPLLEVFNDPAMLALAIAVARRQKALMSLVSLRRESDVDGWKVAFKTAIKTAIDGNIENALKGWRTYVDGDRTKSGAFTRITRKAEIALFEFTEALEKSRNVFQERITAERDLKIYDAVMPRLGETIERIGSLFRRESIFPDWFRGASSSGKEWAAVDGALYVVPPSPDSTINELKNEDNQKTLNLRDIKEIGGIVQDIEKMNSWLQKQPESRRGGEYYMIKRMVDRMTEIQAVQYHRELSNSFVVRMMGSLTDMLEMSGSPAASKIAAQLKKFATYIASFAGSGAKSAVRNGKVWSRKLTEAKNAVARAGVIRDMNGFKKQFYHQAMQFFHHRRDILNDAPNRDIGEDRLIDTWLNELRKISELKPVIDKSEAELRAFYKQTAINSRQIAGISDDMGVMVYESEGNYFRGRIGSSLTTTMRQTNSVAKNVYNRLKGVWGRKEFQKSVSQIKEMSEEEFNNYILQMYEGGIGTMDNFVSKIVKRPGKSVFKDEDGNPLPQGLVKEAFDFRNNSNNMKGFLDTLTIGAKVSAEDSREFQANILHTLQGFYGKLNSVISQSDEANGFLGDKRAIPIHVMMDARKFNDFPLEWVDYAEFTERKMYQYVKNLAAESAFGRDMVQVNNDFALANSEMDDAASFHDQIEEKIGEMGLVSRITGWGRKQYIKRYDELAKELQGKGAKYTGKYLRNAINNQRQMKKIESFFKAYISKERDSAMEFSVFNDLIRSMTGLIVQSPGTALIDTISIVEQPWKKMGLNRFGFQMMKNNITNSLGLGFGSFFQMFNRSIKFAHDDMAKMMDIGLDDATASLEGGFFRRLRTEFQSNMADEMVSKGLIGKAFETTSRGIRAFLETGIGSAEEGRGAFPVFRPQAIFSQIAKQSSMANTISTWKMFRNFIVNAAEYIENNPEAMEIYNKHGMIFNEKALGQAGLNKALDEMGYGKSFLFFNNSKAYHHMYNTLLEAGFNVEQVALDYINRKKTDMKADPLAASYLPTENALYMALAHTTVSQVMMETDVTTRSPIFLTNGFAYASMPLLGWSVQKFVDVNKTVATDRNSYGYLLGNVEALKAYLAVFPIGLIYAYLRDEYDEEILGKKSSLQAGKGLIFKGDGMPSLEEIQTDPYNALQIAIERFDRVGTFGFGGEIMNTTLNNESGRELSIDSRVYALNTLGTIKKVITNMAAQRSANYATVYRPLATSLGGAGFLQYAQILNNGLAKAGSEPMFEQEYAMASRISTNNYLRAAGRYMDLDVRTFSGAKGITSTRMRPWVSEMLMAAVVDDEMWFDKAWQRAVLEAEAMGKEDPIDSVKRSFQAYHPLRYVFQTMPTAAEYYELLDTMNADGQAAVQQTIRNINEYGTILGITPSEGKLEKPKTATSFRSQITKDLDLPSSEAIKRQAFSTAIGF